MRERRDHHGRQHRLGQVRHQRRAHDHEHRQADRADDRGPSRRRAGGLARRPAEKPAPTGMPCTSAAPRLARPNAPSSRLGSTRSPWRSARVRIVPQLSANRISTSGRTRPVELREHVPGRDAPASSASPAESIVPTTATPRAGRSNAIDAAMPAASTMKAPGTAGSRRSASSASEGRESRGDARRMPGGTLVAISRDELEDIGRHGAAMPTISGNWRTMMVIARPKAKPRSTGREMKPVRPPRRSAAAARKHRLDHADRDRGAAPA